MVQLLFQNQHGAINITNYLVETLEDFTLDFNGQKHLCSKGKNEISL